MSVLIAVAEIAITLHWIARRTSIWSRGRAGMGVTPYWLLGAFRHDEMADTLVILETVSLGRNLATAAP